MRVRELVVASALTSVVGAGLLSGCGGTTTEPEAHGDCGPSIGFHGMVYVTDTRVDQSAPKGPSLDHGRLLDCDHRTILQRVDVSTVKGATIRQAISVRGHYHGVYVADDLAQAQWPVVVRTG